MKIDKQELFQWAAAHQDEQLELLKELAAIPAPSHHEEQRVAFIKDWLIKQGAEGVTVDESLNVKLPIACEGRDDITVYMAHTDVVFPDMTPLPVHAMIAAMQSAGIPAQLSLSAGAYVCNDVYYALLSCFERGLFLHVPDADVVDADTAARAITICMEHP